jgi:hypothetical protein
MSDSYTEFGALSWNPDEMSRNGYAVATSGPKDDKLIVGFYRRSELNKFKSKEQGKAVHEGRDFVKIQHPGETLNIVDRPVQDSDKQRWPRQWAAYAAGKRDVPDGVPIDLLFPSKPEVAATMRGYNIHTVEQLSNLSGSAIDTVGMGAQDWVNAAKRYMDQANRGVNYHQFEKAMADKDAELRQMKRQIADLSAMLRSKQAEAKEPPADFDPQTAQINAMHQSNEPFTPEPATFVHDLSGSVEQPKRRGRPAGSKNKPKEIA